MSQARRSGRQRRSTQKYSENLFKDLNRVESDSEQDPDPSYQIQDSGDDDDFNVNQLDELNHENDENDLALDEISNTSEDPMWASSSPKTNNGSKTAVAKPDLNLLASTQKTSIGKRVADWQQKKELNGETRSRGLIDPPTKSRSKENLMTHLYGSNPQDWVDVLRSRDQWIQEPTLPKKNPKGIGDGGMCFHFSHSEEKRNLEAFKGWDWYYDYGGKDLFVEKQQVQVLTSDKGNEYISKPTNTSHKCLMGPYGKQRVFSLSIADSLNLDDAWDAPLVLDSNGVDTQSTNQRITREGWMLNVGTSVNCLDWVSNQDGDVQYLAVATARPKSPTQKPSKVSPAYTPSPPLKSSIQIWEFAARETPDQQTLLDHKQPPELRLLICTEWGDIKQLKWCPMPRAFRDEDFRGKIPLGLLAGIWTDGSIRVLDVHLDSQNGSAISYAKYNEPAFQAFVPNTLCTCAAWLSATDLAVGCSNGFLAIWDISTKPSPNLSNPNDNSMNENPNPWLYHRLHESYILTLTPAYPSYPHLLASASVDGYMRLTDLRSPQIDSVLSARSRMASSLLAFSAPLLAFISTEENDFLRVYPIRTFNTSASVARADAFPLCIAVGHFHPTILFGCSDGSLVATNPMRKILNRKAKHCQQTVLRHEWTRHGGGMSRITEGYKTEIILLQRKAKAGTPMKGDGIMSTIYERETAITEVVWNPNLKCGGWVAVGMGSGLLRVQDLAI